MNVFQRAAARLPLTPAERASLHALNVFVVQAIIIGAQTAITYLSTSGAFDFKRTLTEGVFACISTLMLGLRKYATANGDAAFQTGVGVVQQEVDSLEANGSLVAPTIDFSTLLPQIEGIVAKWVSAVDPHAAAPTVAQHIVSALRSEAAQQASQKAASAAVAPVRTNTPPVSQPAPSFSQTFAQAPVFPITAPNIASTPTVQTQAVNAADWMNMGPPVQG